MKKLLVLLLCLLPLAASAEWFERCDPPNTKSADRAATTTARAIVRHLDVVAYYDCLATGATCRKPSLANFFSRQGSMDLIWGHSRMVYQFFRPGSTFQCAARTVDVKPGAPAVAAWDKLSTTNKARVRALDLAPE